jgi:hypothetical protein
MMRIYSPHRLLHLNVPVQQTSVMLVRGLIEGVVASDPGVVLVPLLDQPDPTIGGQLKGRILPRPCWREG